MEESLRYDPAVQTLTRHTTAAVRFGNAKIAAGETVQCMVGGANRDPTVFEDPERFKPGRANVRKHLAFGLGNHFCLGAQLARAETRSALRTLLERWPGVEFDRCVFATALRARVPQARPSRRAIVPSGRTTKKHLRKGGEKGPAVQGSSTRAREIPRTSDGPPQRLGGVAPSLPGGLGHSPINASRRSSRAS
ncbi:MAG: cytochrome P450 [Acidobacteria bacterium]|nr:cytochrome P450 [Acidobacteriota bacterium]